MRLGRVMCALGLLAGLGCSGNGGTTDAGSDRPGSGSGGSTGSGGGGGGNPDAPPACTAALTQANFCQPTFDQQVQENPCDAADATTAMCGSGSMYKVWSFILTGSQTCVYNMAGTMLVGARNCDATIENCANNCITYGIPESNYAEPTCSIPTPACP